MAGDGEFDESKHPRDHGKFTESGGGSSGGSKPRGRKAKEELKAKSREASIAANAASDRAHVENTIGAHRDALIAHERAMRAASLAGNRSGASAHNAQANNHDIQAKALEATGGATSSSHAAATLSPPAAAMSSAPAAETHSDQHLAAVVHQTIQNMPDSGMFQGSRFGGGKAYVGSVYDSMSDSDRSKFGTLDEFKSHLARLNSDGHIALSRIDSRGDADADKLDRSEFTHGGVTYHAIQGQESRRKGIGSAAPQIAKIGDGEFEEDKHPRAHDGKFTSGGGASRGHGGVTDAHRERAKQALTDAAFVQAHANRLSAAGDEARAKYPVAEHHTDAVHEEAQRAIHEEAARAIAEHDAHQAIENAGASAEYSAEYARRDVAAGGGTLAAQHEAVMAAISTRGEEHQREQEQARQWQEQDQRDQENETRAVAAGHISTEPRDIVDRHDAEQQAHGARAQEHIDRLEQAHLEAATAIGALHDYEREEDEERGIGGVEFNHTHDLGAMFDETHGSAEDEIGKNTEHSFEELTSHGHNDHPEIEIPAHPDSDEWRSNREHLHPDDEYQPHEFENPHPDDHEFEHPHPDELDDDHTPEEHRALLAAHDTERAEVSAAHDNERRQVIAAHEEEYNQALAAHNEAASAEHAELKARAEAAQSALERLHEHQTSTHDALKDVQGASAKSRSSADKALGKFDEHDLVTSRATGNDLDRAKEASASFLDRHRNRFDEDAPAHDFTEMLSSLRAERGKTEGAIRELSKITGRAPRLPEKQGKPARAKKGFRPGATGGASVVPMPRYRLKLSKLDFVSPVDTPAQESARVLLIKRSDGAFSAQAKVAKVDEGLGLVFCWAFTSTNPDGTDYHDLQGDAIDADFVKAAADFMRSGGATDEMHDGKRTGQVVFAMPMTPEIAKAYGVETKTTGLMVALAPPPDVLAKFKSGDYTGVSIAGTGVREVVKASDDGKCPDCGATGKAGAKYCAGCGKAMAKRAAAPTASSRPARTASPTAAQKRAVLTNAVDGHQHAVNLDDPADEWRGSTMSTTYNTSEGAATGHSHIWTFDPATGAITIAEDSGHAHTVEDIVPPDVLRQAALIESGVLCGGCGGRCEADCKFCPSCGAKMDGDGVPGSVEDEDSGPTVVVVSARAGNRISPRSRPVRSVKSTPQEPTAMADHTEEIRALKAENALLKSMATLTDAQRAHHGKLIQKGVRSDADRFLALTAPQRDTELAELAKSDEVVYTSKRTGRVYRKSDHLELIEAAQQSDAMDELQKRLATERSELEFTKRGAEVLSHFNKGVKGNIPMRLMKAVAGEFTDAAERAEVERALMGANHALKETFSAAKGVNPHVDATTVNADPQSQLTALAKRYATENKVTEAKAFDAVLSTAEGAALYAQIPTARA